MEWLVQNFRRTLSSTETPKDDRRLSGPSKKNTSLVTEEQMDFLRASLTDMRNLAKQMDACFGDVATVVSQQSKILTQCEASMAEAAKKMKKSKEVAKEAIRQKMQANKRECIFTTIFTLAMVTGFGICLGYVWSLADREQWNLRS